MFGFFCHEVFLIIKNDDVMSSRLNELHYQLWDPFKVEWNDNNNSKFQAHFCYPILPEQKGEILFVIQSKGS